MAFADDASGSASGRRYFVGIGVGDYDDPSLNLLRAEGDVRDVAHWFTVNAGVEHVQVLDELGNSPTWHDIVTKLGDFLTGCSPDDIVVIWFACHGELEGVQTFLFGRDTPSSQLAHRAIPAATVGQIIGQGHPHNVLVVVDACVAGDLADDIESAAKSQAKALRTRDPHRPYVHAIVASAYGRNPAHDGRFAEAFLRAVTSERWTGTLDRWMTIDQLMRGLRTELRDISPTQVADRTVWGPGIEELIPNPNFKSRDLVGLIADEEFAAHFDPASRGVTVGEAGSFFTGRAAELAEISMWLGQPRSSGLKVITGSPGTGKSALLARTVVLSENRYRPADDIVAALPTASVPPPDAFDGVVWCHNKTASHVIDELARILGGPASDPEGLLRIATGTERTIAIDALDETAGGGAALLAERVLAPLAKMPGIRLLIATRRNPIHGAADATGLVRRLAADDSDVIDLDRSAQSEIDMCAYVHQRLAAAGLQEAEKFAQRITDAAKPSFLVAAIATRTAIASPSTLTSTFRLPTDVGEALAAYINRLDDPPRARALLRPLAWAGGIGLPWGDLWPRLASALAAGVDSESPPTKFTDDDVSHLLDNAGDLVVETSQAGQPRYRLFHEALAEHLRADSAPESQAHQALAAAMLDQVVGRPWTEVDAYVLTQLPHHLLAAGRTDEAVEVLTNPIWDRTRREQAGHPLAAATDAGRAIDRMLETDPGDLRTFSLCHCHSRAMASAAPLVIDVIARSGQFARAEMMANNLTFASDRMVAYSQMAVAYAAADRLDRAETSLAEVEYAIGALPTEHMPMGWFWVARAAHAAGMASATARAARESFTVTQSLGGDNWDVPNGLFWSAAAARLAHDESIAEQIRSRLDRGDLPGWDFRNQPLQAAAASGHRAFLRDRFEEYLGGHRYPLSPLRPGNLTLALADGGMHDEAAAMFEHVTDDAHGEDDGRKRWVWSLALEDQMSQAILALGLIRDPTELSKAIARLVEIAADRKDHPSLDKLSVAIEPLLTALEGRTRARMIRALWLAGKREHALGLAEDEIAASHARNWITDPRDSSGISVRAPSRGKTGRREMVTSTVPVDDERKLHEIEVAAGAGDMATAIGLDSEITVPLFRARAGAVIARHHPDASVAAQHWLRALAAARVAGRGAVDELETLGYEVFERGGRRDEFHSHVTAQNELDASWDFESFAEQYKYLRRTVPPGNARTARMETLMLVPRRLGSQRTWRADEVGTAWQSGDDGKRLFVLGLMQADPSLANAEILRQAIRGSRSAFEQYQALLAAQHSELEAEEGRALAAVTRAELVGEPRPDGVTINIAQDADRRVLAERLVARFPE